MPRVLQGGMRTADVAWAINCNVHTVRPLRQRYRETGWTADRPRSGRPCLTTPGLRACRPVVRQVLTRHHRQQHRLWAQTHSRRTRQDWQKVLFTDVLRVCLTRGDDRIRVYRRRNERYTENCTLERDRFGGAGSVMVWGGVSQHHRTELVIAGNLNAVRYREDILLPYVVPFL
uniref:Transposase Tc1-like domain-containing protein n=1 Tax=Oncorhynchus tshawytscha TaxID=74940 RepID=A0AAZ3QJE3_ONCTS